MCMCTCMCTGIYGYRYECGYGYKGIGMGMGMDMVTGMGTWCLPLSLRVARFPRYVSACTSTYSHASKVQWNHELSIQLRNGMTTIGTRARALSLTHLPSQMVLHCLEDNRHCMYCGGIVGVQGPCSARSPYRRGHLSRSKQSLLSEGSNRKTTMLKMSTNTTSMIPS